jgi:hypothetical protein
MFTLAVSKDAFSAIVQLFRSDSVATTRSLPFLFLKVLSDCGAIAERFHSAFAAIER